MGNKTSPNTLRLGVFKGHDSRWFANSSKDFKKYFLVDWSVREFLKKKFQESAGITKIFTSRNKGVLDVAIKCIYPSVIIGKKGGEVNQLVVDLSKLANEEVRIKIFDIKRPEVDAGAIALKIADEIKRKSTSTRRVIKKYGQLARKNGVQGIRIQCSGRLGGVELARVDVFHEGAVPRHKLRAMIDYASVASQSKWGTNGVKVLVYNGDIVQKKSDLLGGKNVKS